MFDASRERTRSRAFRGAILVLVLVSLVVGWRKWSEPRYLGRGIRSWIDQLPYDTSSNSEAHEAMRAFGPRAVPYLVEAAIRPQKWEVGPLAKLPQQYVTRVVDLEHLSSVRFTAVAQLTEMAREEIEDSELAASPQLPVTKELIALWKRQFRGPWSLNLLGTLRTLGRNAADLTSEFKTLWQLVSSAKDEYAWSELAGLLAETHDPTLVHDFVRYAAPTNSDYLRISAVSALGRNGHSGPGVKQVLLSALNATNQQLTSAGLFTCVRLNICVTNALRTVKESRTNPVGTNLLRVCDIVEPILRWRLNPDDPGPIKAVETNLTREARADLRFATPDLLAAAGPQAKTFIPALSRMAREDGIPYTSEAIRALRAIDETEARKVIATLPPPQPRTHARTARANEGGP